MILQQENCVFLKEKFSLSQERTDDSQEKGNFKVGLYFFLSDLAFSDPETDHAYFGAFSLDITF